MELAYAVEMKRIPQASRTTQEKKNIPIKATALRSFLRQGVFSSNPVEPPKPKMHPFIEGLLQTLPSPNTQWGLDERGQWLQTAAGIFALIYSKKDGDTGAVTVKVENGSAK